MVNHPLVANEVNPDAYVEHWCGNKIAEHLTRSKHQRRFRVIGSKLPDSGKTFVDIGCAQGHSTNFIRKWRNGEWAGVDFAERAIREAQALFPDIAFAYCPDFDTLPDVVTALFPVNGAADGVVCSEVIEHVKDDEGLVRALWECTGNTLVITTPAESVLSIGHVRLYDEKELHRVMGAIPHDIHRERAFWYVTARRK